MNLSKRKELLSAAITASLIAGKEILEVYNSQDFEIQTKSDNSPLTIADQRAHQAIVSILDELGIPVLSEEGEHLGYDIRKNWDYLWIVDPLDGTKEFIKRNDEFTVNIALIEKETSIAGVIYVPVYKQLYFSDKELGAFRMDDIVEWSGDLDQLIGESKILPLSQNRNSIRVVASRSHMNQETKDFISKLQKEHDEVELISKGSSLKLCMIAEGEAEVYPRYAPTMEWDIAAGHAIVSASGGKILHLNSNEEIAYNKEDLLNPWFICKIG
ncbi:3'(2'),5'-bisphosphate nucleotidase CysQ [Labilibaculum antarcticum]|uniref:3'(2'),5'-bisphosphate nucleotidase CysQ n=1 Tax=Labilibaculum antarcticum TaxID=1717717 RepID=A0A1Y1CFP3_9BACT|nr:3'(2'),5'-bisphosphate nucleotidase CysQ [Labilibaculum antarcticum]BAX78923.1 3'(2'),5'-bisphosphate nucleotidase [Labilibaculum antarcticum]